MKEIYDRFAYFYFKGPYAIYSKKMARFIISDMKESYKTVLDLGCGEGTFAMEMAKNNCDVTAVDNSEKLLTIAMQQATKQKLTINFINADIRNISFSQKFDLVTSWYDTLNYILKYKDLEKIFKNVYEALNPGGTFMFDMNTIYGLAVIWQRYPSIIQQNNDELFEVHIPSYDYDNNIASLHIIGFRNISGNWIRFDEIHYEKGYSLDEIVNALKKASFKKINYWGNIVKKEKPTPKSGRIWFEAKK